MMDDDLSDLFAASPAGMLLPGGYVMGKITSFSTVDGSNTVACNGATLTNVPMKLTGAEVNYQAGDPVLLQVFGSAYIIDSKIAAVGSAQFASASAESQANGNSASGFTAVVGKTVYATTSIPVPPWATKAAISAWCTACVHSSVDQDVSIGVDLNGGNLDFITFWGANGHTVSSHVGGSFDYSIPGGTTALTAGGWLNPGVAIASASNFLVTNIQATFYRS
jgi:hypothetical protein